MIRCTKKSLNLRSARYGGVLRQAETEIAGRCPELAALHERIRTLQRQFLFDIG